MITKITSGELPRANNTQLVSFVLLCWIYVLFRRRKITSALIASQRCRGMILDVLGKQNQAKKPTSTKLSNKKKSFNIGNLFEMLLHSFITAAELLM